MPYSLRSKMIRLAGSLPKGSHERRAILGALTAESAERYPEVVAEIEGDFRRKAITTSERDDLLRDVRRAPNEREAWGVIDRHRRSRVAGWRDPINLPSLDQLKLRTLDVDWHPKVLERHVKNMARYVAKGMSPERAARAYMKDSGDKMPEEIPDYGTSAQIKHLVERKLYLLTQIGQRLQREMK
jgi:hypothetical protein